MRLDSFQKALEACDFYLTVALHSRGNMDAQYDLLAATYLTYRDGKRPGNQAIYKSQIDKRIGSRKPTTPETKRPFLFLLHAIFGDELDQSMQRRLSKMTTALEQIDAEFKIRTMPSAEQLVTFIQSSGGIEGLWAKARPVNKTGNRRYSTVKYSKLTNVDGGSIVKTERGYALHMNVEPGEYIFRVQVAENGRVTIKRNAKV